MYIENYTIYKEETIKNLHNYDLNELVGAVKSIDADVRRLDGIELQSIDIISERTELCLLRNKLAKIIQKRDKSEYRGMTSHLYLSERPIHIGSASGNGIRRECLRGSSI